MKEKSTGPRQSSFLLISFGERRVLWPVEDVAFDSALSTSHLTLRLTRPTLSRSWELLTIQLAVL